MSSKSNQFPSIPPISTTETFLLECSRSNSLIDKSQYKVQGGETNATWINSTDNFQIMKGDQISIEMIALNLAQTTTPMEFTGENIILEGADEKEYVDNKVILEIGYYINNNQSYSNNLPFTLAQGINDQVDLPALHSPQTPSGAVNRQNIFPKTDLVGTTTDKGVYPGFGMGFGYKYNDSQALGALNQSAFQYPTIDAGAYLNSYRIVAFTGSDYTTIIPIVAGVALPPATNAWSVILEHSAAVPLIPSITPATPTSFCSYDTFKNWTAIGLDQGMFGSVGMRMRFELGIGAVGLSQFEVVDIMSAGANALPVGIRDPLRVQVRFPRPVAGTLNTGGIKEGGFPIPIEQGAAVCFCTPEIRYNDIFKSQGLPSWNNTKTNPTTRYSQKRQNSGFTDFFSQGLVGSHLLANSTPLHLTSPMPINLAYPETAKRITPPVNPSVPTPSEEWDGMTFLSGGGIGSANRLQGTDNLPYIITRNDFMGTCSKANCEQLGRYETFCPEMRPLTSFIELEATDLLMDATSLASVINEKLHASLPSMGENSNDIRQYQTNVYGFTKRYKKSSQLLPYNTFSGYFPYHSYPRDDGSAGGYFDLSYPNTEKWNRIDDYFSGGSKQIIPANYQPGWNKINYIGYNANTMFDTVIYGVGADKTTREYGNTYPSFESTYLRTCKRPPDWFGDACSWNNCIDGNKGVKDIFKQMWGDSFNRIPVWDGNSRLVAGGTHKAATARNFNMPVILNTQLQNQYIPGGQFIEPASYYGGQTFPTTILVKDQMIFTNMYYNKEGIQSTEQPPEPNPITFENGYEWFDKVRQRLVEKQRDYEIYINASNKTANTNDKQIQDKTGWAIELDLGMTNDYLTNKWVAGYGGDLDSRSIEYTWATTPPPSALALPFPSSNALNPLDVNSLTPSTTSAWFGSGYINHTAAAPAPVATASLKFDWNRNQAVNRSVGKLWIQSKYDSNWLESSNTGGEIEPYPDSLYPQIPQSTALNDTACSIKQPDGSAWADDSWSRENDMGMYPYKYTDVDGGTHIFTAFRVAQTYKAATSQQINSQITNTWRLGKIEWGMRFGFSPSAYDNFAITPMNPDDKVVETTETRQWVVVPPLAPNTFENVVQRGLIENCNSYVAIGADNPTFTYDPTKSRMELTQTYQSTLLSPYNSSSIAGKSSGTTQPPPDLPELGQPVALFNDICPDAVYSPPPPAPPPAPPYAPINVDVAARAFNPTGGGAEKAQNQRSEETGIFIYKIWLPNENWVAPTDINLYSYWSNNKPEGQQFASPLPGQGLNGEPNFALYDDGINVFRNRDNQDNTENNREEIIRGCVEASDENWRGCLLSKLGFTKEQLLPLQGRQFNRYSVNGYNNPQPDLIVTQNTKPLLLNNQSNITLNTAFNLHYIPSPASGEISGLPNYGLGFSNDLPVVVNSTNSSLTAVNPVESTNSPFFQIYSTICPNNYLDNGTKKSIMFYCMKNYQSGNYSYGYGSTFAHTATKSYNLDQIHTEIRNPITGRLMRVLQPNSVITYKITRPIILAPDPYDPETGEPIDPLTTEPIAQDLAFDTDELFNLVPPQQGGAVGDAGFGNIPPAEQENSYFFNGNNQVVNLQSDEAVALQAQSLQNQFNPINSYIPNPDDETKGETKSQSFITPPENVVIVAPYNQEIVEEGVIQGIVVEQEAKEGEGKQKDAERGRTRDRNDRRNARRREQRASESEESGSERRARRTARDRARREERRNPEGSVPVESKKGADVESMPPPPPRPPRGAGGGGEGGGEGKDDKK